jgi:hypothetical protein
MADKDPKWFVENLEGLDWDQIAVVVRVGSLPALGSPPYLPGLTQLRLS